MSSEISYRYDLRTIDNTNFYLLFIYLLFIFLASSCFKNFVVADQKSKAGRQP